MSRYMRIRSVLFDSTEIPLPLSVRLSRRADNDIAGGDNDAFITSVQVNHPLIVADVRTRGTAAAEELTLGESGTLTLIVEPASGDQSARAITLTGAVLTAVEITYEQATMAVANLRFVAEAGSGLSSPFSAEDSQ